MNDELISNLKRVLSAKLPESHDGAKSSLGACMQLSEPILTARVNAQYILANKREQARHPKDKEYTDLDRGVMLEAAVSEYMRDYELLRGLETLLAERLNVLNNFLLQIPHGSK